MESGKDCICVTTYIQVLNNIVENVFFKRYSEEHLAKRLQARGTLWIKTVDINNFCH